MKYIHIILAFVFVSFGLVSCDKNENFEILPEEESFQIVTPISGSVLVLNGENPANVALLVSWETLSGAAGPFTIEMATDDLFSVPIVLGTSNSKSFSLTVEELNTMLLDAGIVVFAEMPIYLRIADNGNITEYVTLVVTSFPVSDPVITSPDSSFAVVLSEEILDDTAITVVWDDPDFGESSTVVVNYDIEVSAAGTDFETTSSLGSTEEYSLEATHSGLNDAAKAMGLIGEEIGNLDLRVKATFETASGIAERFSDLITIAVTPYTSTAIMPSSWGIVGSGYNNWGAFADSPFYTTGQENIFVAYAELVDGEIKFRKNNDWGENYGDTGADGTLEAGGDNIVVTAGIYKITIDFNDNTYTMEEYSWGVVGSGYNNWGADGPDAKFHYDYTTNTFNLGVKLIDGEIKFRKNNDWAENYGDSGADGTLDAGGDNLVVTAGFYAISLDFNNGTYTMEAADLFGIIGSGYNDWGNDGPDFTFTEVNPDIWIAEIVPLIDGEIKFRVNEDWGTNYGDTGADGTLDAGGDNIAVLAGNYRIKLDFSTGLYELNKVN